MGWMHDTLEYMHTDPLYRRYQHHRITFSLVYAFSENFVLALSHDEVVHGKGSLIDKMAGDWWQKFASLRLLFGYQFTHPGKKLLFMGQEFGQWSEWNEDRGLDWGLLNWPTHAQMQAWFRDLNKLYQEQPALYQRDIDPAGFRWIEANDAEQSVLSYLRFAEDRRDFMLVVCNFTPVPRYNYRLGVPEPGHYMELLNSDSAYYGGGNIGNLGGVEADPIEWHGYRQSVSLNLPPLAIVILKVKNNLSNDRDS
jgi:1,4-alpha-glucan branching enzyme